MIQNKGWEDQIQDFSFGCGYMLLNHYKPFTALCGSFILRELAQMTANQRDLSYLTVEKNSLHAIYYSEQIINLLFILYCKQVT